MQSRRRFLGTSLFAASLAATSSLRPAPGWSALLAPASNVDRDIDAVTGAGKSVTLSRLAVEDLARSLRGNLILAGHPAYDASRRVWNAQMDRHPALIIQPRGAADVRNAVQFARAADLLTAVKCGGHSPSGKSTCEKGMLIDLSLLRGVRVDPQARTASVLGGSLLGDLDNEAMAHGLVTTAGTVSHTGVGGLTLGGGFGRVARRFGLSLDNVRAVEIVTASGEILRADAQQNPDLYWGVRGGGGNFGVVTGFDFDLHPMQRQVYGGTLLFPMVQARQVLKFWSEFEGEVPDELYLSCGVMSNAGFSGQSGVGFIVCYSGAPGTEEPLMKKLRSAGTPAADNLRSIDYVALQRSGDLDEKRAIASYTKTGFIHKLSPQLIDAILTGLEESPERATMVGFQHCGGAIARVAPDATAFPHRDIHSTCLLSVDWPGNVSPERHVEWLLKYWDSIRPHTDGFYTNDAIEETQKQIDENYLDNLPRLVRLKNRYDPTNLFRLNANVRPGA
jgi:FAD/FMN-containing dehydrogenase